MSTISELFERCITPEGKEPRKAEVKPLSGPIVARSNSLPDQFEAEVFNFLLAHKEALGIEKVMQFSALVVDGAVELKDGRRLTVEIKFRMNWMKACQSESQFRTLVRRTDRRPFSVVGGLVFFEQFCGDGWEIRAKCRFLENGWSEWYRNHSEVEGFRVDLLRLQDGKFTGFNDELNFARIKSLPIEELRRLTASLGMDGESG